MSESESSEKPKVQVKHDWYQTDAAVVITVLVKNVKEENLSVNFAKTCVTAKIKFPEQDDIELKFNLSHEVVPEQCSYKITPSKIEVKLKKSEGIRWAKLEGPEDLPKAIPVEVAQTSGPPAYPTSKKGKDWSVVEKEIKEEEAKEKPEGEEALNKLFQEIYGKGSDEVKRAMNKSYMESGGTVLSTNWDEISKEKVGVKPPDGMEWKKW
ncbi:protein SGT1 homolog [Tribolium castaneum]|uniref:Suppressor of G2 allele of SKP1 homolog-like Protein n=1 Tax=Tribolium castaneum TaxID=7070 RepID=D6WUH6_TRICA|nr:PREDICTED: protein SGT1 homolog [Tribolium castaneum]EFA08477.1 Suppressor of G2 allele of SKP1 homolog-like Protein [Tribolium castaneum]|eukprot:XP_971703.1 PREDICTED: protein SGT1 homolog [Tribolium castaneum]